MSSQDGPPPSLPWGAWCNITLFCSNEFGLFRRADFPAADGARETLPLEFGVYDRGGGFCAASDGVTVEVVPLADDKDDDEEEEEAAAAGGSVVLLRRNTSCRVQCRVRFLPASGEEAVRAVHLRVGLPPSLLRREVLPVVSLPIRLLPTSSCAAAAAGAPDPDDDMDARLGIKGCRTIHLPALGRALLCAESPGQAGIAGKVHICC